MMKKKSDNKSDNLFTFVLANKLLKPFKDWDICKEGLIDKKGKLLKEGELSLFDKFTIRLKKMINENHLATYVTFMEKDREGTLTRQNIMEHFHRHESFSKIENKVLKLLSENKVSEDDYYSYLLEKLKYDKSILTETLDQGEVLRGGLGDGRDINEFDPRQVVMGIQVEMEHTDNVHEVLEIVADHLTEDGQYYSKLETIEKDNH